MRKITLAAALMSGTAITAPALADEHLQIVDEPLELTIHMHWRRAQSYDESYPVEQAACEMTNICLVDATVGSNTTENREAHNLLLASGEIPDIFGGSFVRDFVNEYGPQGAFLPLDDLIAEHAPNIQAFFDENPELVAAVTSSDGHLYYVPYFPDGEFGRGYFIRQDWLETLGLEEPQNVAELEERLTNRFDATLQRESATMQRELGTLRSQMQSGFGTLSSEFRSELLATTRTYLLGNIALVFTVAAIAFAAARLV